MRARDTEEIDVYVVDPGVTDPAFPDADDRPILEWQPWNAEHDMPGWLVLYREPYGNGVDWDFTPDFGESDTEAATDWARGVARSAWQQGDNV